MATFKCPDCKAKVSTSAEVCQKCGRPVTDADRQQKKSGCATKIVIGVFILLGLGAIGSIFDKGKDGGSTGSEPVVESAGDKSSTAQKPKDDPCKGMTLKRWEESSKLFKMKYPECEPAAEQKAKEIDVIPASKLWNAFKANEVAAKAKYAKQIVAIEGRVSKISESTFGSPEITINMDSYGMDTILCTFPRSAAKDLAQISKGQRVIIGGKVGVFVLDSQLSMDDCWIAK